MCTMCPSTGVNGCSSWGGASECSQYSDLRQTNPFPPTQTERTSGSWCWCADVTLLFGATNCCDINIDVLNVKRRETFHVAAVLLGSHVMCSPLQWAGTDLSFPVILGTLSGWTCLTLLHSESDALFMGFWCVVIWWNESLLSWMIATWCSVDAVLPVGLCHEMFPAVFPACIVQCKKP